MNSGKKEINDYKKFTIQILLFTAVLLVYCAASMTLFGRQMRYKAEKSFLQSVRASSSGLESEIGGKLYPVRASLHTATGFISSDGANVPPEHYVDFLSKMNSNMATECIFVFDTEGNITFQDGTTGKANDLPWFSEVLKGKEVVDAYYVSLNNVSGEKFVISCPIWGRGKVTGAITAVMPVSIFTEAATHNRMEWNAGYILINRTGKILTVAGLSALSPETVIFDSDSFSFKENMTEEAFFNEMEGGKSGEFYCTAGSKDYYVRYEPLKGDRWYLLSLVAEVDRNFQINGMVNIVEEQGMGFVIAFLIFVFLVVRAFLTELKSDSRSMSKLQNDAEKDLLTGVYNKLSTEKYIREYMEKDGNSGLFYIIDLDDFKKINDNYGHAFGDEVLKTVGKRLITEFRATDIVGRLGGDEFCVFLKDLTNEEEKNVQIKRMATVFKDIYAGEHVKYNPTASIGGAEFPKYGRTFEEIYRAADSALYDVKRNGKNGIKIYERNDAANDGNG